MPALVMGILNVTPDSFSDGGEFMDGDKAVRHALRLVAEGAEIIDIGGESTRPGSLPVSLEEEMERVIPVIQELVKQTESPISIDTTKVEVARAALEAGASIVNDIGAGCEDPAMWRLAAETGAGYVAMHMRGDPATMQERPDYEDVVEEVFRFLADRCQRLEDAGMKADQILLDVGIGFGKTMDHNLQLLAELDRFKTLGRPMLIGVSRKSFMGKLLNLEVDERLHAGLACACWAVNQGAQLVRTHDVAATVQAIRMIEAIQASGR